MRTRRQQWGTRGDSNKRAEESFLMYSNPPMSPYLVIVSLAFLTPAPDAPTSHVVGAYQLTNGINSIDVLYRIPVVRTALITGRARSVDQHGAPRPLDRPIKRWPICSHEHTRSVYADEWREWPAWCRRALQAR